MVVALSKELKGSHLISAWKAQTNVTQLCKLWTWFDSSWQSSTALTVILLKQRICNRCIIWIKTLANMGNRGEKKAEFHDFKNILLQWIIRFANEKWVFSIVCTLQMAKEWIDVFEMCDLCDCYIRIQSNTKSFLQLLRREEFSNFDLTWGGRLPEGEGLKLNAAVYAWMFFFYLSQTVTFTC